MKPSSVHIISFKRNYFLTSLLLLITEIIIAVFFHDRIIRPYAGDFLVVILLYCMVRAFFNCRAVPVALGVFLFSCFIEWTQYLKLADYLHLGRGTVLRVLLGDYFSWTDIVCYAGGILTVLAIERVRQWPVPVPPPFI